MSRWAGNLGVVLLAVMVVLIGWPQYLQWRADQAELKRLATVSAKRATLVRDCPIVAKEWEAYKQLRQPDTSVARNWREADNMVLDCIIGGYLKREDIAGYYGS